MRTIQFEVIYLLNPSVKSSVKSPFAFYSMRKVNQPQKDIDPELQMVYDYYDQERNEKQNIAGNQLAPIGNYKMGYLKFVNFQKFHVFQVPQHLLMDERPLTIHEMRKLIRLISSIHVKQQSGQFSSDHLKGIWSIISFIFPSRTGLLMNQYFSMIASQRLPLEILPDFNAKRQVAILLSNIKEQPWLRDKEFLQNIQTLIKQAKTSNQYEHVKLFAEYTTVIDKISQNDEYRRNMNEMITAMTSFGILTQIDYVEGEREEWKRIIENPAFDADYVLSQPDTLVADICQEFEEEQYILIRRKLSDHHEDLEEQTQMNFHPKTASSKKLKQKDKEDDLTAKFKRKINFDSKPSEQNKLQRIFAFDQNDSQTRPYKRLRKQRPTRKNYIDKMMKNYRIIDLKFAKRVQRKRNTKSKVQNVRRQNIFIQKQIKKHTFIDSSLITNRQKKIIQGQKYPRNAKNKISSQQRRNKQQAIDWKQRFVQDESQNQPISISSQIINDDESYSNHSLSQKNKRKRTSEKITNCNKNVNLREKSPKQAKQVKPKRMDYRKKQVQTSNFYMQSSEEPQYGHHKKDKIHQIVEQKTKKSLQKRQKSSQIATQINKRPEGKRENQFKRLRKGNQPDKDQENFNSFIDFERDDQSFRQDEQMRPISRPIGLDDRERQRQAILEFPKINQQKYSHLIYDAGSRNVNISINRSNQANLDRFISNRNNGARTQNFEPLERAFIRKLTFLEFEESEEIQQRMMIIEGDDINPYQRVRKEINEYQLIEAVKMDFTLQEYMDYIESFQTQPQVLKQIKGIANQYLSKTFEHNIGNEFRKRNNGQNSTKLILIARKLLGMYIMAKKQAQLPNIQAFPKIFSHFSLTYINPLLNHYIYQVLVQNYAQIINALFTSEGDQDFQLLSKASLPFLMLFHDIRQLAQEEKFHRVPNFSKHLFEDIYQIIDRQSLIIMFDIIKSINDNSDFSRKMTEKVQPFLKSQAQDSNIHLPRPTRQLMQKYLRVHLHPLNSMFCCFFAYTHFEISLYDKINLILVTMQENADLKKIKEIRAAKFSERNERGEKGHMIDTVECIIQRLVSLNNEDKGISQMLNLAEIVQKILQRMDFGMQLPKTKFSFESKLLVILIRSLKQVCRSSGPSIAVNIHNNRRSQENENKEKLFQTIKRCLRKSLTSFISDQCKKTVNFLALINIITKQQLKQLTLQSTFNQQNYITVELNLQMMNVFLEFSQFRQSTILNRPQVLKIVQKIIKDIRQARTFMFGGKNRLSELLKKMFDLLLVGYKCQIYAQGNIWKLNSEISGKIDAKQADMGFLDKKDMAQQYWSMIKQVFRTVLSKYKQFSNIPQLNQSSINTNDLQVQKFKKYSYLLSHLLKELTKNLNDSSLFQIEQFYYNCNQSNCLPYSIRHILLNLSSFFAEFDFLVDVDLKHSFISLDIDYFLYPAKIVQNLSKVNLIDQQMQIQKRAYDDKDDKADDLIQLSFDRDEAKPLIMHKWLNIVSQKLQPSQLQSKLRSKNSTSQSSVTWGTLSAVEYFKRLQIANNSTQNSLNQIQKSILAKMPILFQFAKKHESLSFISSTSFGSSNQRQIKEGEIEDLQKCFDFSSAFAKFLISLLEAKKCPNLTKLTDKFVRKMVHQSQMHKINLLNLLWSVIVKKLLSSIEIDTNHDGNNKNIEQTKKQKTDNFLATMQLWCKIYQNTHNVNLSSCITYNLSDVNSLLYLLLRSIGQKRKRNQKQIYQSPLIFCLLDECQQVFRTSYIKENQSKVGAYNSLVISLVDTLYNYLKQVCSLMQSIDQKNSGNRLANQFSSNNGKNMLCLQRLSMAYLKLFNTVISWPILLTFGIQKTKLEFEILISKDPSKIFVKSKSLIQNLLSIKEESNYQLLDANCHQSKAGRLKISIQLLQECVLYVQRLEANVYDVKVNTPHWIFIYVMKKIVENQIQHTGQTVVTNRIALLTQPTQNDVKPLSFLFLIIESLSVLDASVLLKKIIFSCLKFLGHERGSERQRFSDNQGDQQKVDFDQLELKVHLMGKNSIPDYRNRLFLTLLMAAKYSSKQREMIEKMFQEASSSIDRFIHTENRQQQPKIQPNQDSDSEKLPESYEEMMSKWLIGYNSDFSLVKTMISCRVEEILKLSEVERLGPQQMGRLGFIRQSIDKSLRIMQKLNKSCELSNEQRYKCSEELESQFRKKLSSVNSLIEKNKKPKNQTIASSYARISSMDRISHQQEINFENYVIYDPIKRESTKMEIQE